MRRIALLIVLAAAGAVPASAHAALPTVLTQGTPTFEVRPAVISYTGDGTGIIGGSDGTGARNPGHLKWTRYTSRRGAATGVVWINDCDPDCAGGRFRGVKATVAVSRPARGHFRRLTLRYTYDGQRYTDRRKLARHGAWIWDVVG